MSEKKEYLSEEKYQKTEKSITLVAIIILIVGLCIGGFLIYRGVAKPSTARVEELEIVLKNKKSELESKGVQYNAFTKYSDGESYDLKIITGALDPSFPHCEFDEYKNNSITKEYCTAKNSIGEYASISSIMFGVFICIAACMFSSFIFMVAKRRHILAFTVQQTMPIAQEGIEKMAPTVGKVGASIAKEMAPVYGDIAKGIAKGIKEGINEADNKEKNK